MDLSYFFIFCLIFACTGLGSAHDDPIVETKLGKVRGLALHSVVGDDFLAFKGIPYAKPPVGELRFKDPVAIEAWDEIKNATKHGSICGQKDFETGKISGSDDCLYINVYTRSLKPKKKLPVMVWIYGGAFVGGKGDDSLYGPDYFMRKDIVLVSFNYRVGILGFLNLEDEVAPGNQGLKDQVMALKWVRDNIASFGGDPEDVTIFGQSAGGASVHYQTISPLAQGLFHKAIIQSGAAVNPWARILNPKKYAYKMAELLGNDIKDHKEITEYLRTIEMSKLIEVQEQILTKIERQQSILGAFGPGIDSKSKNPFMPIDPEKAAERGVQVPLLIGFNNREGLMFADQSQEMISKSEFENFVHPNFAITLKEYNLVPDDVRRLYFGNDDVTRENIGKFVDFVGDMLFVEGVQRIAKIQVEKSNSPTYLYQFTFDKESKRNMSGADHADEIPYLFKNKKSEPLRNGTYSYKIMEQMIELWVNFATTGRPTPVLTKLVPFYWKPLNSETVLHHLKINEDLRMNVILNYFQRLTAHNFRNAIN